MDKIVTTSYSHGQNIRLTELAFDCVFINSAEKEKIIGILEEKHRESEYSDVNVTDLFKQEKFITEKGMAYLLAFDEYLQTRSLDQQFGWLATANELASEEAVAKVLYIKGCILKKIGFI